MQTFMPYADFTMSARSLDSKRLMKQRVECLQIMKALAGLTAGWRNHPATKQWSGHEHALYAYHSEVVYECLARYPSFDDTTLVQSRDILDRMGAGTAVPWWLGHEPYHYTMRGRLYEKDPAHYLGWEPYSDFRERGYTCCTGCQYLWVAHLERN